MEPSTMLVKQVGGASFYMTTVVLGTWVNNWSGKDSVTT